MYQKLLILFILPVITACTGSEPVPFKLGKDGCDHCKMTIMSNKHGLELITDKGKIYKFDDLSCGITYSKLHTTSGDKLYAVDYNTGAFLEANTAFYVKSDKNKTPMNSMILAFKSKTEAEKLQKSKGGVMLTWESVQDLY